MSDFQCNRCGMEFEFPIDFVEHKRADDCTVQPLPLEREHEKKTEQAPAPKSKPRIRPKGARRNVRGVRVRDPVPGGSTQS